MHEVMVTVLVRVKVEVVVPVVIVSWAATRVAAVASRLKKMLVICILNEDCSLSNLTFDGLSESDCS